MTNALFVAFGPARGILSGRLPYPLGITEIYRCTRLGVVRGARRRAVGERYCQRYLSLVISDRKVSNLGEDRLTGIRSDRTVVAKTRGLRQEADVLTLALSPGCNTSIHGDNRKHVIGID